MDSFETLIHGWFRHPATRPAPTARLRTDLWYAVADASKDKAEMGIIWNAREDPRIMWASQYLDWLQGDCKTIDQNLSDIMEFFFGTPPPPSGKDLAANPD